MTADEARAFADLKIQLSSYRANYNRVCREMHSLTAKRTRAIERENRRLRSFVRKLLKIDDLEALDEVKKRIREFLNGDSYSG